MNVSGKLTGHFTMTQSLQDIFNLEDNEQFDQTFEAYDKLYSQNKSDYEVWKHFYFFLWLAIEDAPSSFQDKINLRDLLKEMLIEGKQRFADKADFNFIAGYTVSIFPYEYGDYDDLEKEGNEMQYKATKLEPDNIIYELLYQGSLASTDTEKYRHLRINAAPKVLETFPGNGALNKYFRQVLIVKDEKANR
jgi:hypothetical protein